jgi:hypothetical protein
MQDFKKVKTLGSRTPLDGPLAHDDFEHTNTKNRSDDIEEELAQRIQSVRDDPLKDHLWRGAI